MTLIQEKTDWLIDWLSRVLTSPPTQNKHSIGYMGDGFTGQKAQPAVSKYWKNRKRGGL